MVPDDDIGHWRKEAEGYLGSAGVLFRKGRYPQMLHHCHFAAQSALKASFFAGTRLPLPTR